jgi:hypothetical protein
MNNKVQVFEEFGCLGKGSALKTFGIFGVAFEYAYLGFLKRMSKPGGH